MEREALASRAVARCVPGMEFAAARLKGRLHLRRNRHECTAPDGRFRSHLASGRAASSRDGIDAVRGCGIHRGPKCARGHPPDSHLRARGPMVPAPACPRIRCTLLPRPNHPFHCPGYRHLSPAVFATAPRASTRTSGTASTSGTSAPGSTRSRSRCAQPPAAARTAPDRCRERFVPGPHSGSPAPSDRGRGDPRCGCPAPPSGCRGRAR